MESVRIIPDLEQQGFQDGDYTVSRYEGSVIIGGMGDGTAQGNPVVMIGLQMDENSYLVVQTTLALFLSSADALKAKYGDPRESINPRNN